MRFLDPPTLTTASSPRTVPPRYKVQPTKYAEAEGEASGLRQPFENVDGILDRLN